MKNIVSKIFDKTSHCFIVAEISANHNQDFRKAALLIKKAKECGADAVKFQAYTPDTLTINADSKYFRIKHPTWGGQSLYSLYQKAYTPWKWLKSLKKIADDHEILFFATAFDKTSVDLLEKLNVPFHKIASFEIVDLPLIEYVGRTRKPLIISTGMATRQEIKEAVGAARKGGASAIALLKCVSSYPAKVEEMNLKTIPHMGNLYGCPVGLSDHSMSSEAPIVAVSLGAKIVEKHLTLSRKQKTPDSFFSIEPGELRELVKNIRTAEKALGRVHYGLTEGEKKSKIFRRSLFITNGMKKGEPFTERNVKSLRPAIGMKPKYMDMVLGKKARKDIKRGTPLFWNMVATITKGP